MSIFRKKDFYEVREAGRTSGLEKNLNALDLILFGLGAIIGTGVFVLTGLVASTYSGPAITISFAIAGFTCILVAFVYTEVATLLPTSGSIYTYSYVAFGEVFAWLVGSVLIIELCFASSAVAAGWSAYVVGMLESAHIYIPETLTKVPADGGIINLPAFLILLVIGFVLYRGTKDSKKLNSFLVVIKMCAIGVFMIAATPHFDASNWDNFIPFGFDKLLRGSTILFFAFTGFGVIASAAEECKNPKRDLTIGIIFSLVLSTIVYMMMGALLTGIISYEELNTAQPLAVALKANGSNVAATLVAFGAVAGMATVMMMNLYAQSRIFYVMARDGLLPKSMAKLHPKYGSPYVTLMIFVSLAAILAGFCPYEILGELSAMGALMDYIAVTIAVMVFRFTLKDVERSFKCPMVFVVAPAALIVSVYLLFKAIIEIDSNWDWVLLPSGKILLIWFPVMFVLYIMRVKIFNKKQEA